MSEHQTLVEWSRSSSGFGYDEYNRDYRLVVDEKVVIPCSSAPEYKGEFGRLDPEQGLIGAVSGCHMLTFLAICSKKKLVVDRYEDRAVGFLEKNSEGKLAVTRIELRPVVTFSSAVSAEELAGLHDKAHAHCFIAQSVKADVVVKGESA